MVRTVDMDRRSFLALGSLGICSVSGCIGPLQGATDSDVWQIGEFSIRTSIPDGETVTVKIRDDDTVVYKEEVTLPTVEQGHYREKPVSGYPTEPGLYTVTCIFEGNDAEYQATFTPDQTADNQVCYNLRPFATEADGERSARMMTNLCHEETPADG